MGQGSRPKHRQYRTQNGQENAGERIGMFRERLRKENQTGAWGETVRDDTGSLRPDANAGNRGLSASSQSIDVYYPCCEAPVSLFLIERRSPRIEKAVSDEPSITRFVHRSSYGNCSTAYCGSNHSFKAIEHSANVDSSTNC